ncbi:hypothetical protein B0H19DRAFT_1068134 [Mycena capillaripes]|nr:hypothetical protein B0H19DRAFT_1068134 [Mycena capillaripes]
MFHALVTLASLAHGAVSNDVSSSSVLDPPSTFVSGPWSFVQQETSDVSGMQLAVVTETTAVIFDKVFRKALSIVLQIGHLRQSLKLCEAMMFHVFVTSILNYSERLVMVRKFKTCLANRSQGSKSFKSACAFGSDSENSCKDTTMVSDTDLWFNRPGDPPAKVPGVFFSQSFVGIQRDTPVLAGNPLQTRRGILHYRRDICTTLQ